MSRPRIIIEPGLVQEWEPFCARVSDGSIAADGLVEGFYREDPGRRIYAFDHHMPGRLYARATCAQFRLAVRLGLLEGFPSDRFLYVNAGDEDVCTTAHLFLHPEHAVNPAMARLVGFEDMMDSTSGMFPTDESWDDMLELAAWIFEPYRGTTFVRGDLKTLAAAYRNTIELVSARIGAYLLGRGERKALDLRYRKMGGGPGWALVDPVGSDARLALFRDGVRAYMTARDLGDGFWSYGMGRTPYHRFPLPRLFDRFNTVEACPPDARWGGCDITGGSPRLPRGSRLPPPEVQTIVNGYLVEQGLAA